MKGDFSRPSGEAIRPYVATLHQQGRVWLDADWNDEVFARLARTQTETTDVIGGAGVCAVPAGSVAFEILPIAGNDADFTISGGPGANGRAYVDGLLVSIPASTTYTLQPNFPGAPALPVPAVPPITSPPTSPPAAASPVASAIVYVEVWERLITAEQDPQIREVALGGPDTTVRLATIAQVKVAALPSTIPSPTCADAALYIPGDGSGTLTIVPPTSQLPPDPCAITDPQSYTGTTNALYRVEIHDPGDVVGAGLVRPLGADAAAGATQLTLAAPLSSSQASIIVHSGSVTLADGSGASESLAVASIGQDLLTVYLSQALANAYTVAARAAIDAAGGSFAIGLGADVAAGATEVPLAGVLGSAQTAALLNSGYILIEDDSGASERVGITGVAANGSSPPSQSSLSLARGLTNGYTVANSAMVKGGAAFFKWSTSNASQAVAIAALSNDRLTVTVDSLGRDAATVLQAGDLVEVIDDASDLSAGKGLLTYVAADPDPDALTVTLADPLPATFDVGAHPLLRRWDGAGIASGTFDPGGSTPELDLGHGVQIQFGGSDLRSGDYWQFNVRQIDGSIDPLTNAPPNGIARHRAPLAIVEWVVPPLSSGSSAPLALVVNDCRRTFPSLTDALGANPAIHVTGIATVDSIGNLYQLDNDVVVTADARFDAIDVVCDQPVDPTSISRPTCFVTVELPYVLPQPSGAAAPGSNFEFAASSYQTITLGATVGLASANTIRWTPVLDQLGLAQLAELAPAGDPGLLTRLTLKGNFIRSSDQSMVLDGSTFGNAAPGHTALALPSGGERRGGDFALWFWLKAPSVTAFNLYVSNTPASTVTVFSVTDPPTPNPNVSPARTLDAQSALVYPGGVALDIVGNLYVSNQRPTYTYTYQTVGQPGNIGNAGGVAGAGGISTIGGAPSRIGIPVPVRIPVEKLQVKPLFALVNNPGEVLNGNDPPIYHLPVGPVRTAIPHYYVSVFAPGAAQGAPPLYQLGGPTTTITSPLGIAVDPSGALYVANGGSTTAFGGTILIFSAGSQGDVAPVATLGVQNGVSDPFDIAIDANGRLYVVNLGFTTTGGLFQILVFNSPIGQSAPAVISGDTTNGASILTGMFGITVDKNGLIYVTTQATGQVGVAGVVVFDPTKLAWANGSPLSPGASASVPSSSTPNIVGRIGSPGTTFGTPAGIAVDADLNIYVVDTALNEIFVFAPYDLATNVSGQGSALTTIAGAATGLASPAFIAIG